VTNPWESETEVTPDLVRGLLASQFPSLGELDLERYGEGWDNLAYLVNREWVFRFPKRERARSPMECETTCLLALHDSLPLEIPTLAFVGQPEGDYPYPFSGYRELAGTTSCRVALDEEARASMAEVLGTFLRALHRPERDLVLNKALPGDLIRRTDLAFRVQDFEKRLAVLKPSADLPDLGRLLASARELAKAGAWRGTPRVVHGDLYARHLLVTDESQLSAVIDWGDAHLGDPALDLSIQYAFLPVSAHGAFEEAYGEIDDDTRLRARFRAMVSGAALVQYGEAVGDEPIARAGRYALRGASSVDGALALGELS
jgi:aminoglycoside phosphotransferase (APT) family kinase protein